MAASSRINLHTDLKKIDETRGSFTVDGGDLSVYKKTTIGRHTLISTAKQ